MRKQNRGDIFKKYAGDIFGKTWKAVQVGEWGRRNRTERSSLGHC